MAGAPRWAPLAHPPFSAPSPLLIPMLRATLVTSLALAAGTLLPAAASADAPAYAAGEIVVGYQPHTNAVAQAATARAVGARAGGSPGPRVRVLHVPRGKVFATIAKLERRPGVAFAAPNPIAHASGVPTTPTAPTTPTTPTTTTTTTTTTDGTPPNPLAGLPNDPGVRSLGGLAATQWNFYGPWGINALAAWANAKAAGNAGARNVRIAVLDTGVAYRNYGRYRKSPDFAGTTFVAPYDFVDGNRFPVDHNRFGHGTHVAGTIAETTNNRVGVSGLAWKAQIMPVRVLDAGGYGDAATIAKGIRYAVRHGAQVINMSLEFSTSVTAREIPDILSAVRFARQKGVVVVASTGNEGEARIAYPARASLVISVGATTDDGCLATFSNDGVGLDIVGPGGGADANLTRDPNCKTGHVGASIFQTTYTRFPSQFGLPSTFDGTSMAAPHVSATAALLIASRVLGKRPRPAQIVCRLKATAKQLGLPGPNRVYGYGLVDAGAATSAAVKTPQCVNAK